MEVIKKVISLFLICLLCEDYSTASADSQKPTVIPRAYSTAITWVTDKPATSQIEYSANTFNTQITPENTDLVIYHKVVIYDLEPSKQYQYRIRSKDAYGHETVSDKLSFFTEPPPDKDQPPQISDAEAATIIGAGPSDDADTPSPDFPQDKSAKTNQSGQENSEEGSDSQLIKKEEPIKKALVEKGGLLLKKGKLQIEPTTTYAHTSANKISIAGYTVLPVLVIGEISSQEIKRDIVVETLTARYGLWKNLQIEANVPFRYQHERVSVASPASEITRTGSGLGDISFGVSRQITREKGIIPDMILGISAKAPTGKSPYNRDIGFGTGHWAMKTSLVAVKSSDPAILYASLGYTYNFQRDGIENYGMIKPGDTIDYGFGAAFSLNYQLAFSFQIYQSITQKMKLNDNSVIGSFSNNAGIKYGITWSINKNFSCEVAATNGLTTDAPDFSLSISFPYSF